MHNQQDLSTMDDIILKRTLEEWGMTASMFDSEIRNRFQSDKENEADYILSDEYYHTECISVHEIPHKLKKNERRARVLRQNEAFTERAIRLLCSECTADTFCHTHDRDW